MASNMVIHCRDFLELYSDYRDGLILDEETEAEVLHHLASCRRCMEYDALIARGVIALRATSDRTPSRRHRRALSRQCALAALAPAESGHIPSAPAGVMAGLMVAGILILVGWLGVSVIEQEPRQDAAEPPRRSSPVVAVANPGIPFVSFTELRVPAFPRSAAPAPAQPKIPFGTWVNLSR